MRNFRLFGSYNRSRLSLTCCPLRHAHRRNPPFDEHSMAPWLSRDQSLRRDKYVRLLQDPTIKTKDPTSSERQIPSLFSTPVQLQSLLCCLHLSLFEFLVRFHLSLFCRSSRRDPIRSFPTNPFNR